MSGITKEQAAELDGLHEVENDAYRAWVEADAASFRAHAQALKAGRAYRAAKEARVNWSPYATTRGRA